MSTHFIQKKKIPLNFSLKEKLGDHPKSVSLPPETTDVCMNFMAIHPIIIEIFQSDQSGASTNRQHDKRHSHMLIAKNKAALTHIYKTREKTYEIRL